jgi:hypothetical protein
MNEEHAKGYGWRVMRVGKITLVGFSLVLLCTACYFWVVTRHREIKWEERRESATEDWSDEAYHKRGVYSYGGRIILSETACNRFDLNNGERVFWDLHEIAEGPGFGRIVRDESYMKAWCWHRTLWFPHWAVVALSSVIPLWQLSSLFRRYRMRRRKGYCADCGYDLRASSGRCPECGRAIADEVPNDVSK